MNPPQIALVGDRSPHVVAHTAIPLALGAAATLAGTPVLWHWIGTDAIMDAPRLLAGYAGVWCTPGSPYRSMEGALQAIRHARESGVPFLGTCGGFQHALIEIARDQLGLPRADHAETYQRTANPMGFKVQEPDLVVTPLACSLVGQTGEVSFTPGSRLHGIFGGQPTREAYHCNYGPNPQYLARFEAAGGAFTGFDASGQVRAFELTGHPFFIGTLFQPERAALAGNCSPIIRAFVAAVVAQPQRVPPRR